jgi:hypothetical protein
MANVNRTGQAIEVKGVRETIRALKAFEPEIGKELNKVIRTALNDVKAGAQGRYPKGSWSVRINQKNLLGTIRTSPGTVGDAKSWGDASPGVRAAIFEFAGKYQSGQTPQAKAMIKSLNERYGSPGRFLWDAWDASGEPALAKIREAMLDAERRLQAELDAAGESF